LQVFIAEYDGTTLKKKYIHGPGIDFPLIMIDVDGPIETKYYYLRDALSLIVALLNNSGSVVEKYSYDAFGNTTILSPSDEISETTIHVHPVKAFY
jgi:hypothetical protein